MKNKILYIVLITVGLINIVDVFANLGKGADRDGDTFLNGGDECPDIESDYGNVYIGESPYGAGCPSWCPHNICTIKHKEPVYIGPEWILKIINWHNLSKINDTTYNNAINYLLQKHIIKIQEQ